MPAHAGIHAFVAIKRAQLTRPRPVIASLTRMRASHEAGAINLFNAEDEEQDSRTRRFGITRTLTHPHHCVFLLTQVEIPAPDVPQICAGHDQFRAAQPSWKFCHLAMTKNHWGQTAGCAC